MFRPRLAFQIFVALVFALNWPVRTDADELTLIWADNSTNEDGFAVERRTAQSGSFAEIATLGTNVGSYADSSLVSGATYCYRVRAFNGVGYSDYSNEACGTTAKVFSLTVVKAGTGGGTVASSPSGILCGADCSEPYPNETTVALAVTPEADSVFNGWTDACSGTDSCFVTVTANTVVTATFDLLTASLSVKTTGSGSGVVESAPEGITCGPDCTASFPRGTTVTLAASPAAGSVFGGWKGGFCKGKAATCTVTLTADTAVNATFKRQRSRR